MSGQAMQHDENADEAPAFELGDVNNDGFVNISDATLFINYLLLGDEFENEIYLNAADCNQDGEINISDVIVLINMILNNN